jgi:wobble nucleotide-excising tRNase
LESLRNSVKQAKRDNQKPREKILKELKKVNYGEQMTLEDIDTVVQGIAAAIARLDFAMLQIQNVLDGKE